MLICAPRAVRLCPTDAVADCAVCADGFAPLASYNCRQCSDSGRSLTVGLVAAIVMVLVLLTVLLSAYLTRSIDVGLEDFDQIEVARDSSMKKRCIRWEKVIVKVFPLTSVKTIVVVWQIVSQVTIARKLQALPILYCLVVWQVRDARLVSRYSL